MRGWRPTLCLEKQEHFLKEMRVVLVRSIQRPITNNALKVFSCRYHVSEVVRVFWVANIGL